MSPYLPFLVLARRGASVAAMSAIPGALLWNGDLLQWNGAALSWGTA